MLDACSPSAVSGPRPLVPHRAVYLRALLLGICVLLLYAPVLGHLMRQWRDEPDYSHAVVVPLFSAYVLWRRRRSLREISVQPSWTGMVILCASLCMLIVGSLGAELFLQRLSLVGVLIGLVAWFWGWRFVRRMAFPIAVLLLMIPLPGVLYYQIVFPLQLVASRLAEWILQTMDLFPITREGNVLVLSTTRLEVAEACSGLRSLFSLFTVAVMYAYLAERNNIIRTCLCLVVVPIAVAGNAGRVVFAAVSTELAGMESVAGWSHVLSGIFLFLLSTLLLLLCHTFMTKVADWVVAYRKRSA